MQRKRCNIKYKKFPDSSGNKPYLHSIPTVTMKKGVVAFLFGLYLLSSYHINTQLSFAAGDPISTQYVSGTASDVGTISALPNIASPTASLALSKADMTSEAVTPGNTATTSTNVTVNVSNAKSYELYLKVNSATMTNSSTTISAGNATTDKADFTSANVNSYRSILLYESDASYTGYYNWYTATAGAGNSSVTTDNQNVNTSICPKGWTLPTGGSTSNVNTESTWSDYYKLFRNMGLTISNTNLKPGLNEYTSWGTGDLAIVQGDVYNFKYTGYVYNGSLNSTSYGYWWSSTAYAANYAYNPRINSSSVYPGTNFNGRYNGFAMRCIARDS